MKKLSSHKLGIKQAYISITGNILLFFLKYWIGIQTMSVALIADAWHTLSDSFSSLILLLGVKISAKPADKDHPFGHGRAELIATIIIGTLLAIVGFNFLIESFQKLAQRESASFNNTAIIITVFGIIVKELLAQYAFWGSRKTGSKLLKADGWHHRSDALSSVVVLIGIFLDNYFWWIDSVLGLIISILLFHTAFTIIKSSVNPLLGVRPDPKTIEILHKLSRDIYGSDIHLHHIHCHRYGHHKELTFHIKLPGNLTLNESHTIADKIEKTIKSKLQIEATIHVEPAEK